MTRGWRLCTVNDIRIQRAESCPVVVVIAMNVFDERLS